MDPWKKWLSEYMADLYLFYHDWEYTSSSPPDGADRSMMDLTDYGGREGLNVLRSLKLYNFVCVGIKPSL